MKKIDITKIAIGLVMVFLGIGFLVDRFFNINFSSLFQYFWPFFIMALGVILILQSRRNLFWGIAVFLIGLILFTLQFVNLSFSIWDLWPIILIIIGIRILFGNIFYNPKNLQEGNLGNDTFESVAFFWGDSKRVISNSLKFGKITVIFGESEVNLTESEIFEKGATLDLLVLFGGVKIIVNKETVVENNGLGIFGAFEDKTITTGETIKGGTLKITGLTMFGAVEIRN